MRRRQAKLYAIKRDKRYNAILREAERAEEQKRIDADKRQD
jgi:hypothetical protein